MWANLLRTIDHLHANRAKLASAHQAGIFPHSSGRVGGRSWQAAKSQPSVVTWQITIHRMRGRISAWSLFTAGHHGRGEKADSGRTHHSTVLQRCLQRWSTSILQACDTRVRHALQPASRLPVNQIQYSHPYETCPNHITAFSHLQSIPGFFV